MLARDEELLDVRAAAALVRRSPETIRRWVWSGRLPTIRQGRRLLVRRRDVAALLERRGGEPPMTLSDWAEGALDTLGRSRSRPRRSAADLVLEDRRSRSELG